MNDQIILIEQALLALCLANKESFYKASSELDSSDFESPLHEKVFGGLESYYQTASECDIALILVHLAKTIPGESEFLARLVGSHHSTSSLGEYITHIRDNRFVGKMREFFGSGYEIVESGDTVSSKLSRIESEFLSLVSKSQKSRRKSAFDLRVEVLDELESKRRGDAPPVLGSGFKSLDAITGGFLPGTLNILAANTGVGKTALSLNIAANAMLEQSKRVDFVSLEMTAKDIYERLFCQMAGVSFNRMRSPHLMSEAQFHQLVVKANDVMSKIDDKCVIHQTLDSTIDSIRYSILSTQITSKTDLVIVDYLQLISGSKRGASKYEAVSEVSRGLKCLALDLNIPIIALSQLNRDSTRRVENTPKLSDLRDSGSIEQDSDLVMFISREDGGFDGVENACIDIAKNRRGKLGSVKMSFYGDMTKFTEG